MPLHSGTHWDGLAHCAYDGQLYNGYPTSFITASGGAGRCGIDQLGAAVVGRGVLLDVARALGVDCLPPGAVIAPADLEAAETEQGVRAGAGDVLLVRTGWSVKLQAPRPARGLSPLTQTKRPVAQPEPGLSQACCEWLHAREIAAVAADNYALEVIPVEDRAATLPVHCVLIRDMGMTIGELFNFEELARDCAADGRWQFLFMAPPLKLVNGLGSPINPIVLK
jgi:kynurenine formamidase